MGQPTITLAGGFNTDSVLTPPADTEYLIVANAGGGIGTPTWNGSALSVYGTYGNTGLYYMASPAIGTYTLAGAPGGWRWSCSYAFLKDVNLADPIYTAGCGTATGTPMASWAISGPMQGHLTIVALYRYWQGTSYDLTGTNVVADAKYASGYGNMSAVGRIVFHTGSSITVSCGVSDSPTGWSSWMSIQGVDNHGIGPGSAIGLDGSSYGPSMRSQRSALRRRDPQAYY